MNERKSGRVMERDGFFSIVCGLCNVCTFLVHFLLVSIVGNVL